MTREPRVISHWLRTIHEDGFGLSKWEEEFIESVALQFEERESISNKQEEILERIYSEKTPSSS